MTESGRTEEQRRALREALKRRLADMAALQAAAEAEKKEQEELLTKIKAMEGKVAGAWLSRGLPWALVFSDAQPSGSAAAPHRSSAKWH